MAYTALKQRLIMIMIIIIIMMDTFMARNYLSLLLMNNATYKEMHKSIQWIIT